MEKERREVASLTKIMTFYTVLQLIDRFKIDAKNTFIEICDEVSSVIGTSAMLYTGDRLTIEQLFYGMMLPSGNDASHAMAKFFGDLLIKSSDQKRVIGKASRSTEDTSSEEEDHNNNQAARASNNT